MWHTHTAFLKENGQNHDSESKNSENQNNDTHGVLELQTEGSTTPLQGDNCS